ncbi:MAG: transaldolase [Chloroflexota bacterium]
MSEDQNNIRKAQAFGQSIWLDSISRDLIDSGRLQELADLGVSGITSNPTIFDKAISESSDYDESIQRYAREGRDNAGIFEGLAIEDIRAAADILRPLYDRLEGADGFVSLEVNPLLASDTAGTVEEARRLWASVDRPNVMIKVPGTAEGIPAIRALTSEGININVTLLFSVQAYRDAANAFIDGLEEYARKPGADLNGMASVASFFVSRVDSAVDRRLGSMSGDGSAAEAQKLQGRAAIANAKLAYAEFQELFSEGGRFGELARMGARPQRTLWASTSTKNPDYPDVMYMDGLIGPHTVNTAPLETIEAFLDHGTVEETLGSGVQEARAHIQRLEGLGISMDEVTDELLEAGVKAFADSFHSLLQRIDEKKARVLSGASD